MRLFTLHDACFGAVVHSWYLSNRRVDLIVRDGMRESTVIIYNLISIQSLILCDFFYLSQPILTLYPSIWDMSMASWQARHPCSLCSAHGLHGLYTMKEKSELNEPDNMNIDTSYEGGPLEYGNGNESEGVSPLPSSLHGKSYLG